MRRRKMLAVVIAIVMAIAVIVPTLAFAKEKPRPNTNRPTTKMTQMQREISKHSVAKNNQKQNHEKRNYRVWFEGNKDYYDSYYYYNGYYSAYFNGPSAYRHNYIYAQPDVESVASQALDEVYLKYLQQQKK